MKKRTICTIDRLYPKRAIMFMIGCARHAMLPTIALIALIMIWYGTWQVRHPTGPPWIVVGSLLWLDLALLKRKE